MKIGLSAQAVGHGGGFERYARDLISGLAARGIEPAVFARRFDWALPESRLVEPHRIDVSFLPGKLRDHWFSWRLRRGRQAAGIDVLIGCNRVDTADIAICGGTHVGFLRAAGRKPKLADRWQIALERRHYANARIIVAHSKLMRDELMEFYGVAEPKIRVLYPPVDRIRFAPADEAKRRELRRKYEFGDGEVVLLFPSGDHERKGLPVIERALEGADFGADVVLAVAGRAPGQTSGRVRYLGFVRQIEECYQAADFTILASQYEPFGLVGVESVMCGAPAILSLRVGALDVIGARAKFTFDPGKADSLRAAIACALSRPPGPWSVSGGDLLYNPGVDEHVDSLLQLARLIHCGGDDDGRIGDAA